METPAMSSGSIALVPDNPEGTGPRQRYRRWIKARKPDALTAGYDVQKAIASIQRRSSAVRGLSKILTRGHGFVSKTDTFPARMIIRYTSIHD